MSVAARYEDGVFKPIEKVEGASKEKVYQIFSEEELASLRENLTWLTASERSFEFWDNEDDAVYDSL
jgi:predicted DNA-binding antitoxin AbrB/MazE fold protein